MSEDTAAREMTHEEVKSAYLETARLLFGWARSAGFDIREAKTIPDCVRTMRDQHCDERSMADIRTSGGLPETQELHPEIGRLRTQLDDLRAERDQMRNALQAFHDAMYDWYDGPEHPATPDLLLAWRGAELALGRPKEKRDE